LWALPGWTRLHTRALDAPDKGNAVYRRTKNLRASHIKRWRDSEERARLDDASGLMLAPHIDDLFDRTLISFEDNGRLLWLNEQMHDLLEAWGVDIGQHAVRRRRFLSRQCCYLREHRARLEGERCEQRAQ
jgi:hypothetical protein